MTTPPHFGLGVVIGKFLPPHRGHRFLIETAVSRCDRTVVIVCEKPSDPIPGPLRAEWLRRMIPQAEIMLIDDRYDENDSAVWAKNTIGWLGRAPDVVFTSESYGDTYAGHMGCHHVMVDQARETVRCSGTAVRNDPAAMWEHIDPPVRGWYAKRVVIVGAESTGTTTLAEDLASSLGVQWIPEYGREYSIIKQDAGETEWLTGEFLKIAKEQTRQENEAAENSNGLIICDTNAFATCLWHRRYMGFDCPALGQFASRGRADLYLLTGDEIPFVQDGLRDGEHIRHQMHQWFEESLHQQSVPWHLITGTREQRLASALKLVSAI